MYVLMMCVYCIGVIGCVQHLLSLVQCHIHMCEGVEVWWGRAWEVRPAWLCSSVTCLLIVCSGAKALQSTVHVLSPVSRPPPQALCAESSATPPSPGPVCWPLLRAGLCWRAWPIRALEAAAS